MSKPIACTSIGGFGITLEPNEDREGLQCWIAKGSAYCCSLALLGDLGYLEGNRESDPPLHVPEKVIDDIQVWAEQHGY